jgi:DNA-binding GntR family transcriptional regulator
VTDPGVPADVEILRKRGLRFQRVSAAQAITDALRDEIKRGRLAPLTRILEYELAERFSVSRTPLREALSQLRTEDLREIFWLRATLEAGVIHEVTGMATAEQLAELELILERMDTNRSHRGLFCDLGREFHEALVSISGNQRCRAMLGHLRHHTERYLAIATDPRSDRTEQVSEEHHEVVAAIRSGDKATAAEAMRAHLMAQAEVCIDSIRPALVERTARSELQLTRL